MQVASPMMSGLVATPPSGSYLLDLYPSTFEIAYSPRKLRAAQTNWMIVRRASDNATQTIGFSGDWGDTTAIASFCGASLGYVQTVFNQTGAGKDGTQTNLVRQPLIYDGTNVLTENGFPVFGSFDGFNDWLEFPALSVINGWTLFANVFANPSPSGFNTRGLIGGAAGFGDTGTVRIARSSPSVANNSRVEVLRSTVASVYVSANFPSNKMVNISSNASGTTLINGVQSGSAYTGVFSRAPTRIGTDGELDNISHLGTMSEILLCPSDVTAVRSDIIANQISAFSIT